MYSKIKIKNYAAFTLAETLLTLTIIGIVAVVTIPVLMQNIQDIQFKTLYKKAYRNANIAAKQAYNNNLMKYISIPTGDSNNPDNFNAFKSQFTVVKDCNNNNNKECWDEKGQKTWLDQSLPNQQPRSDSLAFIDSSGMAWSKGFNSNSAILVDTNGFQGPNIYGKDRWWFYMGLTQVPFERVGITSAVIIMLSDMTVSNQYYCPSGNCLYKSWLLN